jgi:hypothetical protein
VPSDDCWSGCQPSRRNVAVAADVYE